MLRLLTIACALCASSLLRAACADNARGIAHPALWPRAHGSGLVDAAGEQFISELMSRMSLEEKVGQTIQADIGNIKPQELREFPLGAVLAGGAVPPLTGDDRSPAAWLDTTR